MISTIYGIFVEDSKHLHEFCEYLERFTPAVDAIKALQVTISTEMTRKIQQLARDIKKDLPVPPMMKREVYNLADSPTAYIESMQSELKHNRNMLTRSYPVVFSMLQKILDVPWNHSNTYPDFPVVPDEFFCGIDNLPIEARLRMIGIYEDLIDSICRDVMDNHVTLQWHCLWSVESVPIICLVSKATTKLNHVRSTLSD